MTESTEYRIATSVENEAADIGLDISGGVKQALIARIRTMLRQVKDPYETEYICLAAVKYDGLSFSPSRSLGWISYDFLKRRAAVPSGMWKWALWRARVDDGELRDSIDYWFRAAVDAASEWDDETIEHAKLMLETLWDSEVDFSF